MCIVPGLLVEECLAAQLEALLPVQTQLSAADVLQAATQPGSGEGQ